MPLSSCCCVEVSSATGDSNVLEVPAVVASLLWLAPFCCWSPSWYFLSDVIATLLTLAFLLLRLRAVDRHPVVGVAFL